MESGDPRRPEPNSGCLSRVSLVVTLEQKSKIHSTSCRSAGSSTTAGRSQVPAAPLLGPSGSGSGRYQTYIHIIPPAEVRSESWPHRRAATAASERREPGREEERPQRCSGAEPSQAVSPVRGADRCDVTAQSAARTPSSFREAPFRINVADVTEPRQETFLEADMKQLFMFTRPERIIAIRLSDKCRKTERINILKKMNICALSQ